MNTKWETRLVSSFLCLVMVFAAMPATVLAADAEPAVEAAAESWQIIQEESITIVEAQGENVLTVPPAKKESRVITLTENQTIEYYGREALSTLENSAALLYAYDQLAYGVEVSEENISVYDGTNAITIDEIKVVMDAYKRDYTNHFWLGNEYLIYKNSSSVLSVKPVYIMAGDTLETAKAAFEQKVSRILSGLTDTMSENEKELYLHDRLERMVAYVSSTNAHNAYGALVEGKAVCEGYAEAFQYLLQRAGIQSFIVTGSSLSPGTNSYAPHAWNIVRIDNDYYHTDSTWDDQGANLYHAYFNLTDEAILEDHIINPTVYPLPACKSESAQYFNKKAERLPSYDAATVGNLLKEHHLSVHIYIPGSVDNFVSWFNTNIRSIASVAGVRGGFSYRCSRLGRELIIRLEPSGSHTFNDYHVCNVCRTLEPGYTAGAGGFSVSLKGDIGLKYHMVLDKSILEDPSAKVVFTIPDGESSYNLEIPVSDATEFDDLQVFALNVAAAEMTSKISAKVVTANGESDSLTYSIKQYADYILANAASYPEEQALVKKMLNYGAAAQLYFDYNAENLANADLASVAQTTIPETAESQMRIEGSVDGISFAAASLVYRNKIAVRYYFTGDMTGKTFTANGKRYTPVLKDDKYYVEVADIPVQNLDAPITLTVADASGNTLTICYNPMNYIVRMNQKDDTLLKSLLKALYNYHLEAKSYTA